jgi:hypothetical protein
MSKPEDHLQRPDVMCPYGWKSNNNWPVKIQLTSVPITRKVPTRDYTVIQPTTNRNQLSAHRANQLVSQHTRHGPNCCTMDPNPKPKIKHQNRRNRVPSPITSPNHNPPSIALQTDGCQPNTARHGTACRLSLCLITPQSTFRSPAPIPPESQSRVSVDIPTCHPSKEPEQRESSAIGLDGNR